MQRVWFPCAVVVLVGGCPDRELSELPPAQYPVEIRDIPVVADRAVDILFVIDNSISMDEEQQSLGANFDRFIDVLDNLEGGLPDLHLGVATSNMGTLGVLTGACAGLGDNGALHVGAAPITTGERFLVDVAGPTPGTRITNYTGDLRSAFAAAASVGAAGCGFEQHLEAMHAALDNPVNAGFIRPEATLVVVIVADEDDCSARVPALFGNDPALGLLDSFRCFEFGVTCDQADLRAPGLKTGCRAADPSPYLHDLARYVDRLRAEKPVAEDVLVAAIVGDREPVVVGTQMPQSGGTHPTLEPSCTYQPPGQEEQDAAPSIRIGDFVGAFGDRGQVETICQDDLSEPLVAIGQSIFEQFVPCILNALADTDPSTPELDPECSVAIYVPGSVDPEEQVLPACDATASVQPCWRLVPDPVQCSMYPSGLAIDIVRTVALPPNTRIAVSCVVE